MSETADLDSTVLILPIPKDLDTWEENRQIRYHLVQGNDDDMFRLNETSGELVLLRELDARHQKQYELAIRASSRRGWLASQYLLTATDPSVIRVTLPVVTDKLLIQFVDHAYHVNISLFGNETEVSSAYRDKAIFDSNVYLLNRKPKNTVRYKLDGVETIKSNSFIKIKNKLAGKFVRVDKLDGRVYLNRSELISEGFAVGDSFRLSILANMYAKTTSSSDRKQQQQQQQQQQLQRDDEDEDEDDDRIIENSVTRLTIKLTDHYSSFIMQLSGMSMREIRLSFLNPMDRKYIGRTFSSMGVKPIVQDIVRPAVVVGETREEVYNLLMQMNSRDEQFDRRTFDLDGFMSMLKNNSMKLDDYFDREQVCYVQILRV